jgi:hypothetical protein
MAIAPRFDKSTWREPSNFGSHQLRTPSGQLAAEVNAEGEKQLEGEGYVKSLASFARETVGRVRVKSRKFQVGGVRSELKAHED